MRAYNESLEGERRRAKRGRSFKRGRLSENTARTILAEKKAWTDLLSSKVSPLRVKHMRIREVVVLGVATEG